MVENIIRYRPPSVNERGDDLVFWVEADHAGPALVRPNKVDLLTPELWNEPAPIFWKNDLLTARWEDIPGELPPQGRVVVRKGTEIIYSIQAIFGVDDPIKEFRSWNGHWVLEVSGNIIVDGQNLNQVPGYDGAFGWHLIHGQPFYFFQRGSRIGGSYAGQVLAQQYDEVVHYRCCEPAAFNPGATDNMIWFHALRGDTWYYVEMGVYE